MRYLCVVFVAGRQGGLLEKIVDDAEALPRLSERLHFGHSDRYGLEVQYVGHVHGSLPFVTATAHARVDGKSWGEILEAAGFAKARPATRKLVMKED